MKTLSNILWVMGSLFVIAGAFFKIMHYAGSAMIMMIGLISAFAGISLIPFTRKKTKDA